MPRCTAKTTNQQCRKQADDGDDRCHWHTRRRCIGFRKDGAKCNSPISNETFIKNSSEYCCTIHDPKYAFQTDTRDFRIENCRVLD